MRFIKNEMIKIFFDKADCTKPENVQKKLRPLTKQINFPYQNENGINNQIINENSCSNENYRNIQNIIGTTQYVVKGPN